MDNNSSLEKIKKAELNILLDFDRVCKSLNLRYSLTYGTLIGAIRHKGFIPWDDDIDVAMPREDYEIFLEKGQELLKERFFIQTYETDKYYVGNYAKIRDISTKLVEYNTQNQKSVGGIYIDVFPIDKAASNLMVRRIDTIIYAIIYAIKSSTTLEMAKNSRNKINMLIHKFLWPVSKLIGTQRLNRAETRLRVKNNKKKNNFIYSLDYVQPLSITDKYLISCEVFDEYDNVIFEGRKFPAIKQYDLYLTKIYGDYMVLPPKEKQVSNHNFIEIDLGKDGGLNNE